MISSIGRVLPLVLTVLILFSCSRNDDKMPYTAVIVGKAIIMRAGVPVQLNQMTHLHPCDTVTISEQSKVKLMLADSGSLYLHENTVAAFFSEPLQQSPFSLRVNLIKGELFFAVFPKETTNPVSISTPNALIRCKDGRFSLSFDIPRRKTSVMVLSGDVTVAVSGHELTVPSCTRMVAIDGAGDLQPIENEDIIRLKDWVGRTAVETPLAEVGCLEVIPAGDNLPPQWTKLPHTISHIGTRYVDTILAGDPENRTIKYEIITGPKGISVHPKRGIITFTPVNTGSFDISIRATDPESLSSDYSYSLKITGETALLLNAPRLVQPDEKFTVTTVLVRKSGISGKYLYRFDIDGDGRFDRPENGRFGPGSSVQSVSFATEGDHTIRSEATDPTGKVLSATAKVIVNNPPKSALTVSSPVVLNGVPVHLSAAGSVDTRDSLKNLSVRWDTNGDGAWDVPSSGFTQEKELSYTWKIPGVYKVTVQVRDSEGSSDTASVKVTVGQGLVIDSIAGPDSLGIGDTGVYACYVAAREFPVTGYFWSIDGAGEIKTVTKTFTRVFTTGGEKKVSCKVIDEKNFQAQAQCKTLVINIKTFVDAKGPYSGLVNEPILIEGEVRDRDSKILSYEWDFDGDGKVDFNSPATPKTTWSFVKPGRHVVILTVRTDDGSVVKDSAIANIQNRGPAASAGRDVMTSKNHKVKLNGTGKDPDGSPIALYEWDLDNDGAFEWSSKENGTVEHSFMEFTNAILRVTDAEGAVGLDTVKVIICPDDMVPFKGGFYCIDKYEWPNKERTLPQTSVTYEEAELACAQAGKRLCTASEWETACRNDEKNRSYPYGDYFIPERCNTIGNPVIKNQIALSGTFYKCSGSLPVFDMSGNAAEWVESKSKEAPAYGGSWQSGENESSCASKVGLAKGRKYFYVGFRCCK